MQLTCLLYLRITALLSTDHEATFPTFVSFFLLQNASLKGIKPFSRNAVILRTPAWHKRNWQCSMATAMLWQRSIGMHRCSKATASACFCAMGLFNGHTVLFCTVPLCYYTPLPKVTSESSIIPAAYATAAGGETAKAGVMVEVTISFKGSQSVSPNDGFYFLFGAAPWI